MSEPSTGAPDLEAGLAEIDRRLREIQVELEAVRKPPQLRAAPRGRSGPLAALLQRAARMRSESAETTTADDVTDDSTEDAQPQLTDLASQAQALSELRARLLASICELVDGYESAVAGTLRAEPGVAEAAADEVTISAGPFASISAVRGFEQALAGLPGVREVTVRGYEGDSRAIIDVRLGANSPTNPAAGQTT